MAARTVSVVIPCRNYASYLGRCIQSLLGQSLTPSEIIVVDDASDDDTATVAQKFRNHGVTYLRVDFHSPLLTRRAGVEATHGEIVCCIDADDYVDPYYLEKGLLLFDTDPNIGIVYSDVEFIGDWSGRSKYATSSETGNIFVENFIHSGALVRRDAIEVAEPFKQNAASRHHEDWMSWRKIISHGWRAVKQEALYYYRKHDNGISRNRHYGIGDYTYYEGAALSEEEITLFTPLAGRAQYWEKYSEFLRNQTWDHRKIRLVLMDTSRDLSFSKTVRDWLAACDYPTYEYLRFTVGRSGLADERRIDEQGHARHDVLKEVRLAMARIYNRVRSSLNTNYLWVIEDDVIPPLNTCERLLRSFCPHTVSVSGTVDHRYEASTVSWGVDGAMLTDGQDVQVIGGNGFGCVMLRSNVFKNSVFTSTEKHADYDRCFYAGLGADDIVKLDWSIRCEHLSPSFERPGTKEMYSTVMLRMEEFDEAYYFMRNPDVALAVRRKGFANGYEHYSLYGFKEHRAAKALVIPAGIAPRIEPENIVIPTPAPQTPVPESAPIPTKSGPNGTRLRQAYHERQKIVAKDEVAKPRN